MFPWTLQCLKKLPLCLTVNKRFSKKKWSSTYEHFRFASILSRHIVSKKGLLQPMLSSWNLLKMPMNLKPRGKTTKQTTKQTKRKGWHESLTLILEELLLEWNGKNPLHVMNLQISPCLTFFFSQIAIIHYFQLVLYVSPHPHTNWWPADATKYMLEASNNLPKNRNIRIMAYSKTLNVPFYLTQLISINLIFWCWPYNTSFPTPVDNMLSLLPTFLHHPWLHAVSKRKNSMEYWLFHDSPISHTFLFPLICCCSDSFFLGPPRSQNLTHYHISHTSPNPYRADSPVRAKAPLCWDEPQK